MTRTEGGPGNTAKVLTGLVVVVTRPAGEDEDLSRMLAGLGADVVHLPMIEFEPPADPDPLERALDRWEEYDWVMFTSPRGVTWVAEALVTRGSAPEWHPPRRLAVVGPTTAAVARGVGWAPELVPERFDAEGLLEAIDRRGEWFSGARVLLPVAEVAREALDRVVDRQDVHALAVLDVGARVHGDDVAEVNLEVLADALVHADLAGLARRVRRPRVVNMELGGAAARGRPAVVTHILFFRRSEFGNLGFKGKLHGSCAAIINNAQLFV